MSTLCRADRESQGNVGQNKTERVLGFYSPDNHSSDEFFPPNPSFWFSEMWG